MQNNLVIKRTPFKRSLSVFWNCGTLGPLAGVLSAIGAAIGLLNVDTSLQEQGASINFNAGLRTFSVSMALEDYLAIEKPEVVVIKMAA